MAAAKSRVAPPAEGIDAAESLRTPSPSPHPGPDPALAPPSAAPTEDRPLFESEAEYELEYAAVCPACNGTIGTVQVIRLLRSRVNFTSTLPRRGRVIICPNCRTILSAALTMM